MTHKPFGLPLLGVLVLAVTLLSCENITGSDDKDAGTSTVPETSESLVTLRINACDLEWNGATAGDELVVWIYPDETPPAEYYGGQRGSILVAEAIVVLDASGAGAAMACQVGTSEPMLLDPTFYVLTAFIDTDGNRVPSSGEVYAGGRDVDVSEDTAYTFDDPDFTETFP